MKIDNSLYEQSALWNEDIQAGQQGLLQALEDFWPLDVHTGIDIGCGDGKLTSYLAQKKSLNLVALDQSKEALSRLSIETIQGDICDLPEEVTGKDIVLCLDVLEHLAEGDEDYAWHELFRVAEKYLFVAVPFNENLNVGRTECNACGERYHVNWHQRTYTFNSFKNRIPSSWRLDHVVLCGESWEHCSSREIDYREKVLGEKVGWQHMVCPACGIQGSYDEKAKNINSIAMELIGGNSFRYNQDTSISSTNTEMLLCFSRESIEPRYADVNQATISVNSSRTISLQSGKRLNPREHLKQYPLSPYTFVNVDLFVQLPDIFTLQFLVEVEDNDFDWQLVVEDLFGTVPILETQRTDTSVVFSLGREAVAGQYGVIFNFSGNINKIKKLELLGGKSTILRVVRPVDTDKVSYLMAPQHTFLWFVQVREPQLLGLDQLPYDSAGDSLEQGEETSFSWYDFVANVTSKRRKYLAGKKIVERLYSDINNGALKEGVTVHHAGGWKEPFGRHVLMLCHDQNIDRRILSQANTLAEKNNIVTILGLSEGAEDCEEYISDYIKVIKIGLKNVVPENEVFKKYVYWQNVLNRVIYSRASRYSKPFSSLFSGIFRVANLVNLYLYKLNLLHKYKNKKLHDPLQYRSAFFEAGKRYQANIIQVHDLPALQAGVELAQMMNVPLVYDAHELYPEQCVFTDIQKKICSENEMENIQHADFVFTVNDSIAEEMAKRYKIDQPITILNALNDDHSGVDVAFQGNDNVLRRKTGLSEEKKILLFQGGMSPHRNLKLLVKSMSKVANKNVCLLLMGPGAYRAELEKIAASSNLLDNTVFFLDAVSPQELIMHSASADVGIIPYPHIDLNSYYCTPNKLFEFIQAGLPILGNESPELKRFIADTGFGMVHSMQDSKEMAVAIDTIFESNTEAYRQKIIENKSKYSWDVEGEKYLDALEDILKHN